MIDHFNELHERHGIVMLAGPMRWHDDVRDRFPDTTYRGAISNTVLVADRFNDRANAFFATVGNGDGSNWTWFQFSEKPEVV